MRPRNESKLLVQAEKHRLGSYILKMAHSSGSHLHSCEITSGSGLGMRLGSLQFTKPVYYIVAL